MNKIVFNRPHATGREFAYIEQAIERGHVSGNGVFAERCARRLEDLTGSARAVLTTSCTSALEMAVLLAGIGPGDEVIMPSYSFVSGANAVALRGGVPVFVDIRADTLNLDEELLEQAITPRTRAILPTHYAGVGCDMRAISGVAGVHGLTVIEDAAQGMMATYHDRALGSMAPLGCISFHETKNVICGEGGALLVNESRLIEAAEIAHEKGTNRRQFFRGQVDKYTWVDLGSSALPSDITAAFLWAQLQEADSITARRLAIWGAYHERLAEAEERGRLRRPIVPDGCRHNGHMYYVLLPERSGRDRLIAALAARGIMTVFHYVPLHSSPAGRRFGRAAGPLPVTEDLSARLVRLPIWFGLEDDEIERVATEVLAALP